MDKAPEMALPEMVEKAGESMMAHEISMAATMAKPEAMTMVADHANMMTPKGAAIVKGDEIKAAIRKVFSDPT